MYLFCPLYNINYHVLIKYYFKPVLLVIFIKSKNYFKRDHFSNEPLNRNILMGSNVFSYCTRFNDDSTPVGNKKAFWGVEHVKMCVKFPEMGRFVNMLVVCLPSEIAHRFIEFMLIFSCRDQSLFRYLNTLPSIKFMTGHASPWLIKRFCDLVQINANIQKSFICSYIYSILLVTSIYEQLCKIAIIERV